MNTGDLNIISDLTAPIIDKINDNIMLNAFRIAVNGSLTQFNMVDGIVDEYEDESGIDIVNSLNEDYDSTNDLYSPTVAAGLTTSPYAHYKCNDDAANTTVTDDGSGANNGVASTNTSNLSVAGKINDAFDLNGSTEGVNIDALETDISSDNTGSFSLWFRSTASEGTLFGFWGNPAGETLLQTYVTSGSTSIVWRVQIGGVMIAQYSIPVANDSNWHHLAIVQNSTLVKMYLDGVDTALTPVVTDTPGAWMNDAATTAGGIGFTPDAGSGGVFFEGQIDDFRYYQNKALTQAEVDAIYNSGSGTEDDQPVGDPDNMTLISDDFTAEVEADIARIVLLEEDVDAITINTDLLAYASRDGGSTYSQISLEDQGDYETGKRILSASVDISGQPSGTTMKYKLVTANNKDLNIHGSSLSWD